MPQHVTNRRNFIGTAAVAAVATPALTTQAIARRPADTTFNYEIQRTDAEWRAMLTEEEYYILRQGATEERFISDLVTEERPGTYYCKGSDLAIYESDQKVVLPIGWVFFKHSIENSVLMGIDTLPAQYDDAGMVQGEQKQMVEVHCRASGNHLGHIVSIKGEVLHCINGTALNFVPAEA